MMEELKPKQVKTPHLSDRRALAHEGVPGPEGDEKTKCSLVAQMLWAKRWGHCRTCSRGGKAHCGTKFLFRVIPMYWTVILPSHDPYETPALSLWLRLSSPGPAQLQLIFKIKDFLKGFVLRVSLTISLIISPIKTWMLGQLSSHPRKTWSGQGGGRIIIRGYRYIMLTIFTYNLKFGLKNKHKFSSIA